MTSNSQIFFGMLFSYITVNLKVKYFEESSFYYMLDA